jgi:protein O-GlcNAc transferase
VIWQVGSCDDEKIARLLSAAGIDVLVDLNAYSAPKWLRLFLRRPAPAQLAWSTASRRRVSLASMASLATTR